MRATLVGQSGSRKPLLRPRRRTQRTVVIGARPAPLLPQSKLFTSAACIFSTTHVFACVCSFRLAVVIRVRPAPSFDQYGLLASTACTFLRRLMFILFWYLLKPARLCGGRPLLGRLGCLRAAPGPPSGGPTPRGTPRRRFGSSRVVSWKSPDLIWEASRPPQAPQSRSRDGANMRPTAPQLPEGDLGGGSGVWGAAPAPPPAPAGPDSTGTCQGNLARL